MPDVKLIGENYTPPDLMAKVTGRARYAEDYRIDGADHALRRSVEIEFAVLPVRHRAARLHRLMAGRLHDERFIDDDRGGFEPGIEIAIRPFVRRPAHRQRAVRRVGKILVAPFQRPQLRSRRSA